MAGLNQNFHMTNFSSVKQKPPYLKNCNSQTEHQTEIDLFGHDHLLIRI